MLKRKRKCWLHTCRFRRLRRQTRWRPGLSVLVVATQALAARIDREEERGRLTREALADADAGRVKCGAGVG